MSKISPPLVGIRIDMGWNTSLVLPPDKMEALVALLNDGVLVCEEYHQDPKQAYWNDKDNNAAFHMLSEETVANAKMHSVLNQP
ncbi:hypothetical protein VPMG_00108 [Vibrio phage VBP32]|uniref:Uncharacterized protein n=2 Tax=Stoningtonvirus VBP47 TaxID=2846606 RepID=M4SP19_9CAUD|nr:hypothetical protein VPNG_00021 [Vibrio phage VBP47]YP_007676598.1 hypothetical protein VPMG_00108 [Vibrio phage VBP32]AGH57045.1 hypothetical protein VPNG_00021 [Vibrio phage VBP47]AGH57247.1 hypothetical protein VPMG_00108 [Vibrio phage VBP32]